MDVIVGVLIIAGLLAYIIADLLSQGADSDIED